ncbi:hypothetical protein MTQ01_02990 [Streptomyces sp. XM4193]|uniref:hypothetical protein n=1 Tax=Streptomyces sp. XM4193 TaxID=2929782 RepID=UPI001FFA7BFE|nr:hypothetical protein [Streptomyces sp. XM4193]MCK1794998.1 hypothetical protein [Streptomyces sp. XM4193]
MSRSADDLDARLATAVRAWTQAGATVRLPLGVRWDVVFTAAGAPAAAVLRSMDAVQRGGCGPVLHDAAAGRVLWLVEPGTVRNWLSPYGLCVGAPAHLTLPTEPSESTGPSETCGPAEGLRWVRPYRHGHTVDSALLHRQLDVAWLGRPRPELPLVLGRFGSPCLWRGSDDLVLG